MFNRKVGFILNRYIDKRYNSDITAVLNWLVIYSWYWRFSLFIVFNATFTNISAISWRSVLLVEETGVPGKNHRHVASNWQTLSHNVVSSTPHHEQGFPTSKNFYRSPFSKWPPQYRKNSTLFDFKGSFWLIF
jgi:hypothetical protein